MRIRSDSGFVETGRWCWRPCCWAGGRVLRVGRTWWHLSEEQFAYLVSIAGSTENAAIQSETIAANTLAIQYNTARLESIRGDT